MNLKVVLPGGLFLLIVFLYGIAFTAQMDKKYHNNWLDMTCLLVMFLLITADLFISDYFANKYPAKNKSK